VAGGDGTNRYEHDQLNIDWYTKVRCTKKMVQINLVEQSLVEQKMPDPKLESSPSAGHHSTHEYLGSILLRFFSSFIFGERQHMEK
jgi:hypothetical protein